MDKNRYLGRSAAWLVALAAILGTRAYAAEGQKSEQELIGVLRSGAPADKALACKALTTVGSKECVPELAKLLADEQLASWARIALEAIPDPSADAALLAASDKLSGKLAVGTINSIGVRRDAKAVDRLSARLKDQDNEVASAAAVALGHIANDAATKSLRQALSGGPAPVRSAVAEGCILCAERLDREGRAKEATEIYDEVRKADVSKPRKLEATRGAIVARKAEGIPLLLEQLGSSDKAMMNIALAAARELSGAGVGEALAAEVSRTSPDRAALVLVALADRGDAAVLPAVLKAAQSGDKRVRVAALGVVGRLGDAYALSPLLTIAAEDDADVAQAAKAAVAALTDKKVDADIAARLPSAEGKALAILAELVGERRISATPALIKALDNSDAQVRNAALAALGATVGPQELSVLIGRVNDPKNSDVQVAQKALRTACLRMPDREACAGELAAAMPKATVATQAKLLEVLGTMGGPKALATIHATMKQNDDQIQDAGSRVLGEWMGVDAAPVLADLAKNAPGDKYRVRAVRGYIRLARQFAMPDAQRAEMCQNALAMATRPDEQKLVLAVLERYPNPETLKVAAHAAQNPALGADAARTMLAMMKKVGGDPAKAREMLAKAGIDPVKVEIVKAEYGAEGKTKDVTETLKKCVDGLPLIMLPAGNYNDSFGGDPVPGTAKILKVQYQMNGRAGDVTFPENSLIMLPMPK
jgi:HEAT repeat protein